VPYHMWFLTPEPEPESCKELIDFVTHLGDGHRAKLATGTAKNWREITVARADDSWAFTLGRCAVEGADSTGAQEIEFFRDELKGAEPAVNVQWVAQYLTRVRTIYTFTCASGFSETSAFGLVNDLIESFQQDGPGGILYAEGEGWSNEDGQHITWEFSDRVTGPWWMAVRADNGWTVYQMELGNREHRRAFKAGAVPAGVEIR